MVDFTGKKFRPGETRIVYNEYGEAKEKTDFIPTKAYLEYLAAKKLEKKQQEIRIWKAKLDYQYKTYGEVDEIDYNYFLYLLKNN